MADSPAEEEFVPSEAQLHELLTTFMGRLRQATEVSGKYQGKLERSAVKMAGAVDLEEVDRLLQDLLRATKTMARDSLGVHEELSGMQERVHNTDQQIGRLHAELDRLTVLARHDPLTGALNRRGMDESLRREVSKVHRTGTALSIAMLDIDDFKRLNDTLGHAAGDAALRHLAVVAREVLRPQDTIARYGGGRVCAAAARYLARAWPGRAEPAAQGGGRAAVFQCRRAGAYDLQRRGGAIGHR